MGKDKTIVLVTNGFPYGDSEQSFLMEEFERLCSVCRVVIVAFQPKTSEIVINIPDDVKVYQISIESKVRYKKNILKSLTCFQTWKEIVNAKKDCSFGIWLKRIKNIISEDCRIIYCMDYLYKLCKKESVSLVYTYWCTSVTLAAVRLKKYLPGLKVVTRFHRYDLYIRESEKIYWQVYRDYLSWNADKLIFLCNYAKTYFCSRWPVKEEKCELMALGTRSFSVIPYKDSYQLHLVSCSALIPRKRVDLIIGGLSMIEDNYYVYWHHIGDGELRNELEFYAEKKLGNKKNIEYEFMGKIPNDNLYDIYSKYNVRLFITTTESEGVPVSVQEALAMGIPAIGTDVDGINEEIIPGKTGYLLLAEPSEYDVAKAICTYMDEDIEVKQKMKANARLHWEKFYNAVNNAEKFVGMIENLI